MVCTEIYVFVSRTVLIVDELSGMYESQGAEGKDLSLPQRRIVVNNVVNPLAIGHVRVPPYSVASFF